MTWKKEILKTLHLKQYVHDLLDGNVPAPQLERLDLLVEKETAQLATSLTTQPEVLQVAVRDQDTLISKTVLAKMFENCGY